MERVSFSCRRWSTAFLRAGSLHTYHEVRPSCSSRKHRHSFNPLAINLLNSSVPYAYDSRTRIYAQPTFAYQTLERIRVVNGAALKDLKTSQAIPVERHGVVAPGTPLLSLIAIGTKDQTLAPTVLEAVFAELGAQQRSVCVAFYRCLRTPDALWSKVIQYCSPWMTSRPSTAKAHTAIRCSRASSRTTCPCHAYCSSMRAASAHLSVVFQDSSLQIGLTVLLFIGSRCGARGPLIAEHPVQDSH